ncbi:uncharacterized protein LOC111381882 [Olea europaea var. sylvestris]|uniref:DUF6821 domain-containing protein n=1 Tax=Olea europaea subsp. europaea TaxID=158383 RepID=A0A8S0T8H7_OLEEU|nr:uncharacterized protein LOC111381882 [Olea europaea var. sylvestris]CAA3000170.1 Hypothetical predicted protein [Olea europaea subsp. europaea]
MDVIAGTEEFQDWELLQPNSDLHNSPDSVSSVEEIGLIQQNYFSLDPQNQYVDESDDKSSGESNNPSWIEPGSEENPSRFLNKDPGEFWTDSSSDRSNERNERNVVDLLGTIEMGLSENEKKQVDFEASDKIVEIEEKYSENLEKFYSDSSDIVVDPMKFNDLGENSEVGTEENLDSQGRSNVSLEEKHENENIENGSERINETGDNINGEIGKKSIVWWKMPIEILKYYVSRVSPVWAVSVAAAVMGFMILGRSLYKMKKKNRGLEIKVTMDDKKVSQFMSRAARLNDAFSVVKRVPVIRPTLPAVGVTPWPAMSLR